jgi:prepilin-type N-terminal cleavage/methylation domain-containing protein
MEIQYLNQYLFIYQIFLINMFKFLSKNNTDFKFNRGFTIIEVLIYVVILGIVSIAIISSSMAVNSSFNKTRVTRDLLESGNNSMERMTREIRQANSVDIANSTLGSNPGVLTVNGKDSGGSARVVKFSVLNGALNIYENNSLIDNLLNQNVTVSNLIFRRISTGTGEAVKIEMTLSDGSVSENFYDTVILRGGY